MRPPSTPLVKVVPPNVWRITCRHILARRPSPPPSFHHAVRSKMAALPPKVPCRLFKSKEGCRYGQRCRFSHDLDPASGINTPPSPTTPGTRSGRGGNAAPRTFCDFYWNTGQCIRGFDCTFRHQKNRNPLSGSTNVVGSAEDEDAANAALDFFTMDNLTQMAGVGLHSTQEGTPENAHNTIKRYLGGGSLTNPADMKSLIAILASVNRRNHSWVRVIPLFTRDGR